jgi:hypothetical protein
MPEAPAGTASTEIKLTSSFSLNLMWDSNEILMGFNLPMLAFNDSDKLGQFIHRDSVFIDTEALVYLFTLLLGHQWLGQPWTIYT